MKNQPNVNEVLTELSGVLHRIPQSHRDIIIRSVNMHDRMVEILKRSIEFLPSKCSGSQCTGDSTYCLKCEVVAIIQQSEVK